MLESKPKKYEFKNSLTLYGISVGLSVIIPSILLYFIGFKDKPKLAGFITVLGFLNLVYYSKSLFDRKNKLVFDSDGIKTKKKAIRWEKVKSFEIIIIHARNRMSTHNLIIHLKKDKEVWIDITDLDLTEQKVELIFRQFNIKKTAANSG